MLPGQGAQHDDRLVHQLRVGRMGHVLGLHRGVRRYPLQVFRLQGTAGMGNPQAIRQEQLELVAKPRRSM